MKTNLYELCENATALIIKSGIGACDAYTDGDCICVDIPWGDWKHSHAYCDYLLGSELGLELASVEVYDEDGSDCFSAIRYYKQA